MSLATGRPAPLADIVFDRRELDQLIQLYGLMVAAGHWRDYAVAFGRRQAVFSAYVRASERPDMRLVKDPGQRQGRYALLGADGRVLKRGDELSGVLAPARRRLMKLVG